jgi:LacI family transcriptional regulator
MSAEALPCRLNGRSDVAPATRALVTADRPAAWAGELAVAGRIAVPAVTSELTSAHPAAPARARPPLVVIDPPNVPQEDRPADGAVRA